MFVEDRSGPKGFREAQISRHPRRLCELMRTRESTGLIPRWQEIKALELELEYLELGQGMPLPKQVMLALPREALEGWKSAKDKFDAVSDEV